MKKVMLLLAGMAICSPVMAQGDSGFNLGVGLISRSISSENTNFVVNSEDDSGLAVSVGYTAKRESYQFGGHVVVPNSEDTWVLAEGYVDFFVNDRIYLGGLLGYQHYKSDSDFYNYDLNGVTAALRGGFEITDKMDLEIAYRFKSGDENFDGQFEIDSATTVMMKFSF